MSLSRVDSLQQSIYDAKPRAVQAAPLQLPGTGQDGDAPCPAGQARHWDSQPWNIYLFSTQLVEYKWGKKQGWPQNNSFIAEEIRTFKLISFCFEWNESSGFSGEKETLQDSLCLQPSSWGTWRHVKFPGSNLSFELEWSLEPLLSSTFPFHHLGADGHLWALSHEQHPLQKILCLPHTLSQLGPALLGVIALPGETTELECLHPDPSLY